MALEPSIGRIRRELRQLWVNPPPFCRPGPSPVTDLVRWEVVIDGPSDSPYAGGSFPVVFDFNKTCYPLMPPKITFKTKMYHPNIDSNGDMMLDIFDLEYWTPAMSIRSILLTIVCVLCDPKVDDHTNNEEVNNVYKTDLELYEQTARAWTAEYSSTPIVSHYLDYEEELRLDCFEAEERQRLRAAASSASPWIALRCVVWKQVMVVFLLGSCAGLLFATRFSSSVCAPFVQLYRASFFLE